MQLPGPRYIGAALTDLALDFGAHYGSYSYVMTRNTPTVLYRAVKKGEAVENHLKGTLWFHSHRHFRNQKDGDILEGVGSYERTDDGTVQRDVSDKHPIQPAYFLCFSETPEGAQACERQDYDMLEIKQPDEFCNEIRGQLPNCGFVEVRWIQIEYSKTCRVDDLGHDPTGWHRKFNCKPEKFAVEKEWRLQIQFMHSFRIQNCVLKFRWGDQIGHFFMIKVDN